MFKLFSKKSKNSPDQVSDGGIPVIFAEREEGWRIHDSVSLSKTLQESSKKITSIFNNLRGFRDEDRAEYFDPVIHGFVRLIGSLPASENNHDAREFGLLDHSLSATLKAVCFHKQSMKSGGNTNPAQARCDAYAVFIGALLHDVGKVHDMDVYDGANTKWDPVEMGLLDWLADKDRRQYKFKYVENRAHKHEAYGIFYLHKLVKREHLDEIGLHRVMDIIHYYSEGLDKSKSKFGSFILRGDMEAVSADVMNTEDIERKRRIEEKQNKDREEETQRLRKIEELEKKEEARRIEQERKKKEAEDEKNREAEARVAEERRLLDQKKRELEELMKKMDSGESIIDNSKQPEDVSASSGSEKQNDELSDVSAKESTVDLRPISEQLGAEPYVAPQGNDDKAVSDEGGDVDVDEDLDSSDESDLGGEDVEDQVNSSVDEAARADLDEIDESDFSDEDVGAVVDSESEAHAKKVLTGDKTSVDERDDKHRDKRERMEEKKSLPTGVVDVCAGLGDLLSGDGFDDFDDVEETIDEDAIVGEEARKKAKAEEEGVVYEGPDHGSEASGSEEANHDVVEQSDEISKTSQGDVVSEAVSPSSPPSVVPSPSAASQGVDEEIIEDAPQEPGEVQVTSASSNDASRDMNGDDSKDDASGETGLLAGYLGREGKLDFEDVFSRAFSEAYKNDRLQVNEPKGNTWVGEEYTMLIWPSGIRSIYTYGDHHKIFMKCKRVPKFDKSNDNCLADVFRDLGVVYRSEFPELGLNTWFVRITPENGNMYKKDLWVIFLKNDFCWKYVDTRPSMVGEKFKVTMKSRTWNVKTGKQDVVQFGDAPFARRRLMYLEKDWEAKKPMIVWTKKYVHKMIDWLILYYEQCDPKTNRAGGYFFKNDDALFVVYPRFIGSLMAKQEIWNQYAFQKDYYCPKTVILNTLKKYRKMYVRGSVIQMKITIPEIKLNAPLGVIGIQKRFIDEKAFNRYKSVDIEFINHQEWSDFMNTKKEKEKEERMKKSMENNSSQAVDQ
jgi:hypothetical protein